MSESMVSHFPGALVVYACLAPLLADHYISGHHLLFPLAVQQPLHCPNLDILTLQDCLQNIKTQHDRSLDQWAPMIVLYPSSSPTSTCPSELDL